MNEKLKKIGKTVTLTAELWAIIKAEGQKMGRKESAQIEHDLRTLYLKRES